MPKSKIIPKLKFKAKVQVLFAVKYYRKLTKQNKDTITIFNGNIE
jgi:hypothetical protein